MATRIGTIENINETDVVLPRTCIKAIADKNGEYLSEDVTASDFNALKNGAISSLSSFTTVTEILSKSVSATGSYSYTIDTTGYKYVFVKIYVYSTMDTDSILIPVPMLDVLYQAGGYIFNHNDRLGNGYSLDTITRTTINGYTMYSSQPVYIKVYGIK